MDLSSLTIFVKYGSELLFGKLPRKTLELLKAAEKINDEQYISTISKQLPNQGTVLELNMLIDQTYSKLSEDLVKYHKQYQTLDKKMEKEIAIHGGSVMETKQTELDNAKRIYERVLSTVTTLAECLNKDVPILEVSN